MPQVPLDPQFEQRKQDILTKAMANLGPWECVFDQTIEEFIINSLAAGEIRVYVNSPDLGAFTEVTDGGSQAVGTLLVGAATEYFGLLELRIENDAGATATLSISAPTFPSVPGNNIDAVVVGTVGDNTPNPFSASLAIGVSEDRFLDITSAASIPAAFTLDVSIANDDPDENPFTFQLTGTLDGGV